MLRSDTDQNYYGVLELETQKKGILSGGYFVRLFMWDAGTRVRKLTVAAAAAAVA